MSRIQKELVKVTDVAPKGMMRPEFLVALMAAVANLKDEEWDGLSTEAQDWYNANAEAKNKAKKGGKGFEPTDFPDAEVEEEEEKPRGRRQSNEGSDDAPKKAKKEEPPSLAALKDGQRFKLTTKRGKTIEGTVVENNAKKEYLVYADADGEEDEIDYDKVDSLEVFHGTAGSGDDEPDAGDAEPKVGDTVELTTKRGKVFKGEITELSEDEVVIETEDGAEDFSRDRVESIKVLKASKPAKASKPEVTEKEEPPPKGKGRDKEESATEEPRKRSTNEGVSIGQVIKEILADDLDATEADVAKALKKRGLEFKENTLKLNYVDCQKFITVLRDRKLLKK